MDTIINLVIGGTIATTLIYIISRKAERVIVRKEIASEQRINALTNQIIAVRKARAMKTPVDAMRDWGLYQ